jgi:hypothetical protein
VTPQVTQKRELLRQGFTEVVGEPFKHFFCPMLFVDEETELCQAHVVNRAFDEASSVWTVQRKDIDNFYGSMFEARFTDLRFKQQDLAVKAWFDPDLYRRFRPRVLVDGVEVPHFIAKRELAKSTPQLVLERGGKSVRLGLKLPDGVDVREDSHLEFEVDHDFVIPAVVSVLKAAHLTAFALMEYKYALGRGGAWLGHQLGSFYLENRGLRRTDIVRRAAAHFRMCAQMVRPVQSTPPAIGGTVDDYWVHFCWSDDPTDRTPWALIFYVKTDAMVHAALLPAFEHDAGADRFARFLESDADSFDTTISRFNGDHWTTAKDRRRVEWPAAAITDGDALVPHVSR